MIIKGRVKNYSFVIGQGGNVTTYYADVSVRGIEVRVVISEKCYDELRRDGTSAMLKADVRKRDYDEYARVNSEERKILIPSKVELLADKA